MHGSTPDLLLSVVGKPNSEMTTVSSEEAILGTLILPSCASSLTVPRKTAASLIAPTENH